MDQQLLSRLKEQADEAGRPTGFKLAGPAEPVGETFPPPQTFVWESDFAILAVVPVPKAAVDSLTSVAEQAREWLWRRLIADERRARFIDGYLVLALPTEPNGELRAAARQLELDTATCRKHVIWPLVSSVWKGQLWRITTLALPQTDAPIAPQLAIIPELPEAATRGLKYFDDSKSYVEAAEKLREQAVKAAYKEISDAS